MAQLAGAPAGLSRAGHGGELEPHFVDPVAITSAGRNRDWRKNLPRGEQLALEIAADGEVAEDAGIWNLRPMPAQAISCSSRL